MGPVLTAFAYDFGLSFAFALAPAAKGGGGTSDARPITVWGPGSGPGDSAIDLSTPKAAAPTDVEGGETLRSVLIVCVFGGMGAMNGYCIFFSPSLSFTSNCAAGVGEFGEVEVGRVDVGGGKPSDQISITFLASFTTVISLPIPLATPTLRIMERVMDLVIESRCACIVPIGMNPEDRGFGDAAADDGIDDSGSRSVCFGSDIGTGAGIGGGDHERERDPTRVRDQARSLLPLLSFLLSRSSSSTRSRPTATPSPSKFRSRSLTTLGLGGMISSCGGTSGSMLPSQAATLPLACADFFDLSAATAALLFGVELTVVGLELAPLCMTVGAM